jgi:hypothetical protein
MRLPRDDDNAPDWPHLQAAAMAQGGYFSLREARAWGIGRQLLQHHIGSGFVRRVGRAVFQFAHFAPSIHEDCVAAWIWSRGEGVLSHATALWLHGLIDEQPSSIHLSLPMHWRRLRVRPPPGITVYVGDVCREEFEGEPPLRFSGLDRALMESAWGGAEPALVEAAFLRAHERGLRDTVTLSLWLPHGHPLRRHFPLPRGGRESAHVCADSYPDMGPVHR